MIPPLGTARTTAREVQLRGVPVPTPRFGTGRVQGRRLPRHRDRRRSRARRAP